jgi:hypothetical protein
VADDYSWSGSTIFSLANPSLFGYTEYTFNVTASSASTALQFEGFLENGELWPILNH